MSSIFESLGYKAGRALMKGRLVVDSAVGSEEKAREADAYIGGMIAAELSEHLAFGYDPAEKDFVRDIGRQLAGKLKDKSLEFDWYLYNGETANAFALPGGFMFIGRPILKLAKMDPNQTAFILAHEMAHVVKRHAAARMVTESLLSAISHAVKPRSVVSSWLKKAGMKLLTRAYSRSNETEADEFAVRLMRAAGFDTRGAARMLEALHKAQKHNTGLPASRYFSTHPQLSQRIENIRETAL